MRYRRKSMAFKRRLWKAKRIRRFVHQKAAELRAAMTPAEKVLHYALLARGFVFDAQKVIQGKIHDFYFPGSNLIVEVDGGYHNEPAQKLKDANRDRYFSTHGFSILRLTNDMVLDRTEKAVSLIFMRLGKADQKVVVQRRKSDRQSDARAVVTAPPTPSL